MELNYPDHDHPHSPFSVTPNSQRLWVCDECDHIFADEEIRKDMASVKWGHACKCHPKRKGQRCESHLESYMPELGGKLMSEKIKPNWVPKEGRMVLSCPGDGITDCGSTDFIPGPMGGLAQHIECNKCHHRFNYMPGFGLERIGNGITISIDSDESCKIGDIFGVPLESDDWDESIVAESIATSMDWSSFEVDTPDQVTCRCETIFPSHVKFIGPPLNKPLSQVPCPNCGTRTNFKAISG